MYERPNFRKDTHKYSWDLEVLLHPSFDFLLMPKGVPRWVLRDDELFLYFLAGYTDGEGILSISKNTKRDVAFLFCIASEDLVILAPVCSKLKTMGFHPTLRILRKSGEINVFSGRISRYRKDHWVLRMKRKAEVIKLLQMLPIRHSEKIRKRQLMFELKDKIHIKDIENFVLELRSEIKAEVLQYARAAEEAYHKKEFTSANSFL